MASLLRLGASLRATATPRATAATGRARAFSSPGGININHALKKAEEGGSFRELAEKPVTTLQGIGPKHAEELSSLGLTSIRQLAAYKFFHLARSVTVLAATEEAGSGGAAAATAMNLRKGFDKEFEGLPLTELARAPVHALQGIAPDTGGQALRSLGVKTVGDLAGFKYCVWSEAIVAAAQFEE